ncbi:hypothetical protein ES708_10207 [subsurface metagenome]
MNTLRSPIVRVLAAAMLLSAQAGLSPLYADEPPLSDCRLKTQAELELEQIIDKAYRSCLGTCTVAGVDLVVRIPFGQSGERRGGAGFHQRIFLGGKGDPEKIWTEIDRLLASEAFAEYVSRLQRPAAKTVIFDLEQRRVSVYFDPTLNDLLREGPYPGTRTKVYVLKTGSHISSTDVYNFLYCIGAVGLDCSGFIYNVQKTIAAAFGLDLDRRAAADLGTGAEQFPGIIGLWFFDPEVRFSEVVDDRIDNLRPGDVILFRGRVPGRGIWFRHSAVIHSVDFDRGLIRYLQCTDWAAAEERGVHDSWVRFASADPKTSLGDPALEWSQTIQPTFAGETPLRYWQNDGHRYRSYREAGGSLIVRLKIIKTLLQAGEPNFYKNVYGLSAGAKEGETVPPR